jgi:hypothetical protein
MRPSRGVPGEVLGDQGVELPREFPPCLSRLRRRSLRHLVRHRMACHEGLGVRVDTAEGVSLSELVDSETRTELGASRDQMAPASQEPDAEAPFRN